MAMREQFLDHVLSQSSGASRDYNPHMSSAPMC
jgi:hypothetical protein